MNEQIAGGAIKAVDTLTQTILGALVVLLTIVIIILVIVLYKLYIRSSDEAKEDRKELLKVVENQGNMIIKIENTISESHKTSAKISDFLEKSIDKERENTKECWNKNYSKTLEIEDSIKDINKKLDTLISCDISKKS